MPCKRQSYMTDYPLEFAVVIDMLTPVAVEDYLLSKGTGLYQRKGGLDPVTGQPIITFTFSDEHTATRFRIATSDAPPCSPTARHSF